MRSSSSIAALAALLLNTLALAAAEPSHGANPKSKAKDDKTPAGVSATDSPETARKRLVVAPGLKVDLWAAEPLIQDVVNFSFDEQGRAYVVETGRRRTSVFDIRSYRDWVDADLSFRTPWDRAAFLKTNVSQDNAAFMRQMGSAKQGGFRDFNKDGRLDWRDLEVESEHIKLVWDSTGSGVADKSAVFADGFNTSISGVAAGVLARRGEVYFTSIPDVWKMHNHYVQRPDTAPLRPLTPSKARIPNTFNAGYGYEPMAMVNLATGFGVHIAYGGHDMHGLQFGPDGKLYWTIADRGAALTNLSRTLNPDLDYLLKFLPDTGAVFRSNPDGSELEVVAIGLRNPQELAFDDFGNLFTADNNADGGDKARWVHIVEGADYGWRYGWQHLPKLGAWNAEMLWGLAPSNTALSYPPPVAHIGHGPAGIAHYPGTGLPDTFRDCFFYADFPGGIRYFRLEPSGASFKVANAGKWLESNSPDEREGKLLWNLYPTDIEFGPDGGAYVLDWVAGWEKTGKGRIWRVHDPAVDGSAAVKETKQLLATIGETTKPDKLAELLGHPNQRVREEALHTLCAQGHRTLLAQIAKSRASKLALIGVVWGLSRSSTNQFADSNNLSSALNELAQIRDSDIRAIVAKAMRHPRLNYFYRLEEMLHDPNLRVRANAAESLGWLKHRKAIPELIDLLKRNADQDATVRNAAVYALVRIGDTDALLAAAKDKSASVRLGACLALRRLMHPGIAQFLDDPDPRIVLEAARAIADLPIEPALPKLADLALKYVEQSELRLSEPLLRRVANANFRIGGTTNAGNLAMIASLPKTPESISLETIEMLAGWPSPSNRDKVTGLWRPLAQRTEKYIPGAALFCVHTSPVGFGAPRLQAAAVRAALALEWKLPLADEGFANTNLHADVRLEFLHLMQAQKHPKFESTLALAIRDSSEVIRKEASRLSAAGGGTDALARLAATLQSGTLGERQSALQSLASLKGKEADDALRKALTQLLEGKLPKELHLDVLEAAAKRTSPSIKERLAQFEAKRDAKDPLAKWRECLTGGDAKAGRVLFHERQEAACARCHKLAGEGGDVGPDLAGLVAKKGREYALESIVLPNRVIAQGFESLLVVMKNGQSFAGLVKSESGDELTLNSPEDGILKLKKADIAKRTPALSPMPESLIEVLTKREIRDLVEFLATAK